MSRDLGIVRRIILFSMTLVLVAGYPLAAMADTQEPTAPAPQVNEQPATPAEPATKGPGYVYNPETGRWDSQRWQYNPETNAYERPPKPVIVEPPASAPAEQPQTDTSVTSDTTVTVDNTLHSDATSGNSAVKSNTSGGNATTGDAAAVATLMNSINSSIGMGNDQKVATFTQDIMGDVKGDIVLYPMLLKAMLEAQAGGNDSATVKVNNDLSVNNNINLNATSGNAAVTGNTTAGNATTGSAHAVANVVNILNSMIAAQESFIGTINIYGNLEGDILIAPDFIPQMLAHNGTADSAQTTVSNQDTQTIVNNISAVAESGAAEVFGNTTAGNATSGNADSNVVIFNLTGHEVIAKNSLLVFVNVLGKWVGVIVDAPSGATSAMIGNGVTSHSTTPADLSVTAQSTHGITNTISVTAQSGDATVAHNTSAGNATTGHAMAMANVANVSNTQLGLSDWFGVLFINVFQNWHGSFGIDTIYGDEETSEEVPSSRLQPAGPVQFIPTESKSNESTQATITIIDSRSPVPVNMDLIPAVTGDVAEVLASSSNPDTATRTKPDAAQPIELTYDYRIFIIAGSILLIGLTSVGLKRLFG